MARARGRSGGAGRPSARDVVAEIAAYERALAAPGARVRGADGTDLTAAALRLKLEALAASPFRFFRGTFHLFARDLLQARVPGAAASAPEALIVGDLHLENFGVYRGASGALCFDVNDFDDVGVGPADLDLKRLCTSAFLLPGLGLAARRRAARALADAWASAVERLGGRFPVAAFGAAKARGPLRALLAEKGKRSPAEQVDRIASGRGRLADAEGRSAHLAPSVRAAADASFAEYVRNLRQLKAGLPGTFRVLDAAYRFKGTGSLGRLRVSLLVECRGEGAPARRLFEIKEARPSALDVVRGSLPAGAAGEGRAAAQTAAIRRMQGDPWPRVAGTHLGKREALAREVQPEEEKIAGERFAEGRGDAAQQKLLSYAAQCGEVLGRLHCRASAPQLLAARWDPRACARAATAFAERYAVQVEKDHRAFLRGRDSVARALGLGSGERPGGRTAGRAR